jgi:hypothetical protein
MSERRAWRSEASLTAALISDLVGALPSFFLPPAPPFLSCCLTLSGCRERVFWR